MKNSHYYLGFLTLVAAIGLGDTCFAATTAQDGNLPALKAAQPISQSARIAADALQEIEDNVFSGTHIKAAAERIKEAANIDPNEPMVYVAWAGLVRVTGFMSGDWHNQTSFEPGVLDKVGTLAQKALDMAKANPVPEAHLMLA